MQIWILASRTHICQMWKIGICNFSLSSLYGSTHCSCSSGPAQIIAINTFFLLMTKLALSLSVFCLWSRFEQLIYWSACRQFRESWAGRTLLPSLPFVKSCFLSACIFLYAIPCISMLELKPRSLWWKNVIAFTLALCPDSTFWMRN